MKTRSSPRQLRSNIDAAKQKIELIRRVLDANAHERTWGLGVECYRTSVALKELVDNHEVPTEYKVAVVGRFKAGKSAFVNELLGRSLAGENTNPETAAVTTFRHGDGVKATIHFLSSEEWAELKKTHKDDPKSFDAQRVNNWVKFAKRRPDPEDSDAEVFSEAALSQLQASLLKPGGRSVSMTLLHMAELI